MEPNVEPNDTTGPRTIASGFAQDAASAGTYATDGLPTAEAELRLAFAPIHKRAFGMAIGFASALVIVALTLFHLVLDPRDAAQLGLLGQYFYGYDVSWTGLLVGAFWAFVTGFVMGWFAAFCRNLALAASVFISRTRVELSATRDFLDHI